MSTDARREEILRILRNGKHTTVAKLAEQLDVSERTIYRDLSVLSVDRWYPIDTKTGRGGGVFMNDYKQDCKGILSQIQIKALNTAIKTADHETAKALQSILFAYA